MKIGELSAAVGTSIETIRFYEREHLLPAAARTASNYRIYGAPHVERLRFICHCRTLDMALDEIRVLLRFKDAPHEDCGQVNALLDDHIAHVAERIAGLEVLARQLKLLREQCQEVQRARDCGILQELSSGTDLRTPGTELCKPGSAGHHVHGTHR